MVKFRQLSHIQSLGIDTFSFSSLYMKNDNISNVRSKPLTRTLEFYFKYTVTKVPLGLVNSSAGSKKIQEGVNSLLWQSSCK